MFIGVEDATAFIGLDEYDEKSVINIKRSISAADKYLRGAIGENYPQDDERIHEIALRVVGDLYDKRSNSVKSAAAVNKLTADFAQQLRLELAKEAEQNGI